MADLVHGLELSCLARSNASVGLFSTSFDWKIISALRFPRDVRRLFYAFQLDKKKLMAPPVEQKTASRRVGGLASSFLSTPFFPSILIRKLMNEIPTRSVVLLLCEVY